jgi:hypothetical protein
VGRSSTRTTPVSTGAALGEEQGRHYVGTRDAFLVPRLARLEAP